MLILCSKPLDLWKSDLAPGLGTARALAVGHNFLVEVVFFFRRIARAVLSRWEFLGKAGFDWGRLQRGLFRCQF